MVNPGKKNDRFLVPRAGLRPGFTAMECMVVLAVLVVMMTLLAQVSAWSLGQRGQNRIREDVLEAADNILESARATPWEGLTPEWAAGQRLPESLTARLPKGRLTVRVEPEASRPHTRRVTVEITWKDTQPVRLVGLFSARTAEAAGGKP